MGETSSGLMQLRPLAFRYKKAHAKGTRPLQYGLIAEEVAEVYPGLVVYSSTGEAETLQCVTSGHLLERCHDPAGRNLLKRPANSESSAK